MTPPVVLTIAGSDPSGSSGLQADLPTIAALGAHGTSVITVITAQDSIGVKAFHDVSPELVSSQLRYLVADLAPAATKTGLLRTVTTIDLVAEYADRGLLGLLVVDPVMVDSAGHRIVDDSAITAYRRLAASATVLTPNRWEAELLTGLDFEGSASDSFGPALLGLGCPVVVVTGGRGRGDEVVDLVVTADRTTEHRSPRVGSEPIRGTGCTFSAALAASLATGTPLQEAPGAAHDFVRGQLTKEEALRLGTGRPGVPHHLS